MENKKHDMKKKMESVRGGGADKKQTKNKQTKKQTNKNGHTLKAVKYLEVILSKDISWTQHVDNTAAITSKTPGFLR